MKPMRGSRRRVMPIETAQERILHECAAMLDAASELTHVALRRLRETATAWALESHARREAPGGTGPTLQDVGSEGARVRHYLLFFPEDSDEGMEVHGPFKSAEMRRLELGGYVDKEGVAADHPHAIYLDVSDDGSPIVERVTEAEAWRAWEDFQ